MLNSYFLVATAFLRLLLLRHIAHQRLHPVTFSLSNTVQVAHKLFVPRYITEIQFIFIGPESDHWECLSVTHSLTDSLTNCCLVNLIDVALACEDDNSNLVEVVTVAHVDAEDHVGNSLL